jgi:ankyrin repeat protein
VSGGAGGGGAVRDVDVELCLVCTGGDVAGVKRAIAAGARLDVEVKGDTPLMWACRGRRADVVSLLLSAGAQVNQQASQGMTALMVASIVGWEAGMLLLLEAGADVAAREADGVTALHWAVKQDHLGPVKLLVAAGA